MNFRVHVPLVNKPHKVKTTHSGFIADKEGQFIRYEPTVSSLYLYVAYFWASSIALSPSSRERSYTATKRVNLFGGQLVYGVSSSSLAISNISLQMSPFTYCVGSSAGDGLTPGPIP